MNRTEREIERVLLDVILLDGEQDEAPDLSDMATRAKAILAKRDEERRHSKLARKAKARSLSLPGKTKADKRAEHDARMDRLAEIRLGLHAESGGTCAVCKRNLPFALMHAHHIISGPERREEERQETMAPCHNSCHGALHGKNTCWDQRDALALLLGYCVMLRKDPLAIASLERRIAKIDEARRSTEP